MKNPTYKVSLNGMEIVNENYIYSIPQPWFVFDSINSHLPQSKKDELIQTMLQEINEEAIEDIEEALIDYESDICEQYIDGFSTPRCYPISLEEIVDDLFNRIYYKYN